MGKKGKPNTDLGRSLIKDRFGGPRTKKFVGDQSMLHTTEIHDGYEWGRLNLQSVTEESSFQEFLSTAELAGTEFQAEKLNIKFINPKANVGLLSNDEKVKAKESFDKNRELIRIPRRPSWNVATTPDELHQDEKEHFLNWRRGLSQLQEDQGLLLTPFEKNLEFWRQLWRVVERSDVVAQIVDARNPLLFRCEDLEKYVKEVSVDKMNLVLINKSDLLTETQRKVWAEYFSANGISVVFFSALNEANVENDKAEDKQNDETYSNELEERDVSSDEDENKHSAIQNVAKDISEKEIETTKATSRALVELEGSIKNLEVAVERSAVELSLITAKIEQLLKNDTVHNSSDILNCDQLTAFFKNFHKGKKVTGNVTTVGLVGYPNVGKSSTINALLAMKKVSVSATPGKTKHFQTLFLDKSLLLCDCPGLVMPSFVYTKAEMVVNGILPIDQMRDHIPPINLISSLIPRHILEDTYGIMLPKPMDGEDPDRCPTSEELLNAYGYNRGFMTANGQPDNPRASRYILKDFVNGKLLYAHAPPGFDQNEYHTWPERQKSVKQVTARESRAIRSNKATSEDIDKLFFQNNSSGVHIKGKSSPFSTGSPRPLQTCEKPWKIINKHENKKKREKLRRLYAHLDQH